MRTLMVLLLFFGALSEVATSQSFKKHRIGESAQEFFSVATMAENKGKTEEYCRGYLSDPNVMKAYDKWIRGKTDIKALRQSLDVTGCWDVRDAIEGKDIKVGARFASEIGQGDATFHASKLALLNFVVPVGTPMEDVVTDVSEELGHVQPNMSVDTMQNSFGATLQRRRAVWQTDNLIVSVMEMKSFASPGGLGIDVAVADPHFLNKKEENRQASRSNTIR
jgi:hypothetical protein